MATASSFLTEDQFLCSICLDVFTEPISTPCGHNFCQACIRQHWKDKEQCQCPLCNKKFAKDLKLNVNTGFKEIVDNFKAHQAAPVKLDEVPCDHCLGTKFKALKTCLVCLSSYCGVHLEPHHRDAALISHKLTHPVKNLSNKLCKKHNKMCDSFCRDDLVHVCERCVEHRGHHTVSLKDEYKQQKAVLQRKMSHMEEMIHQRERKVQEIKEYVAIRRMDKDEVTPKCFKTFSLLVASIEVQLAKLSQAIEDKHKAAERQAEMFIKELKEEIDQLHMTSNKLERLSHIEDHLELIDRVRSLPSSTPHTKNWSEVSIISQHGVARLAAALNHLEDTMDGEMQQAAETFRTCCEKLLQEEPRKNPAQPITELTSVPEGHRLEVIRQQYAVDITYDPFSGSDFLLYSDDLKQVLTYDRLWFPDRQKQRSSYAFVLGNKSFFKVRFYFEVKATMKTGWDIGVARQSINQNRKITDKFWLNTWVLRLRNSKHLKALHTSPVRLPFIKKPERVGVFVDYEVGLVSFYDVDNFTLIYSFTGCDFNERIYPYFSPCPNDDGLNAAPLVLARSLPAPHRRQNPPIMKSQRQHDNDFYKRCFLLVVMVIVFFSYLIIGSQK
ncbi:E3 ubiquitin-protein ligase TRIM21-like [Entelurus aequoreus]|uniref:E3 ubiquitin-protein ligase TRIM21-like n=1 Tax=Entelurus aequoreus TaxID=161455 RepID=UPI002B1DB9B1|nr:E3 ubiquitin-protein ligase TRIM21-like [Entelurus aequoreus]XP_061920254.1 E3 ubiquitin-protein ligase TRIM21-like [Entelurus aequoreus]